MWQQRVVRSEAVDGRASAGCDALVRLVVRAIEVLSRLCFSPYALLDIQATATVVVVDAGSLCATMIDVWKQKMEANMQRGADEFSYGNYYRRPAAAI